jgi:hypothetical protein
MPYRLTLCLTGLDVVGRVIGSDTFVAFPVVKGGQKAAQLSLLSCTLYLLLFLVFL